MDDVRPSSSNQLEPQKHVSIQSMEPRLSIDSTRPREQAPPIRAERNLNSVDVACLIINKMVGTGIFTSPLVTLITTKSKSLAFMFWVLGFAYTILSMSLYLEFARELPYTGGELVYLDHVFRKPRLLAFTMYAFYFVSLYTLVPNNLQFAYHALKAANINDNAMDRDLLCFIAFVVTTFVCLLMFFSSVNSRWVNTSTAFAKILLLIGVFIAGCIYLGRYGASTSPGSDWGIDSSGIGWTQGIISVFFSFHGWENATFVSGEIPRYEVLRKGFITAVLVVGALYVAIAGVVCAAFSWESAYAPNGQNYMAVFFGNNENAERASAILICLSSLGSMVSIAYTSVRVKQIIGWLNILPFSKLWRRTDLSRKLRCLVGKPKLWQYAVLQANDVRKGTPEGGIILHYMFSLIMLGVTRGIRDLHASLTIPGTILISGHFIFEVLVGFGYAFLLKRGEGHTRELTMLEWNAPEPYEWFSRGGIGPFILGTTTGTIGLFVVCTQLAYNPGWWFVVVMGIVSTFTLIYWFFFVWRTKRAPLSGRTDRKGESPKGVLGMRIVAHEHGVDDVGNPWRQCSRCQNFLPARAHRHREDGYRDYNFVESSSARNGLIALAEFVSGDTEDISWDLHKTTGQCEGSMDNGRPSAGDGSLWERQNNPFANGSHQSSGE